MTARNRQNRHYTRPCADIFQRLAIAQLLGRIPSRTHLSCLPPGLPTSAVRLGEYANKLTAMAI